MSERIVIVGAGVSGLGTALALSRAGRECVVLEADAPPPAGSPDEIFARWDRPGVPQLRHSHGFLGRLRNLVRERYPDLYANMLAAGIRERRFVDGLVPAVAPTYEPRSGDEDLTALLCRRTTLENTLYRYVVAQPGVEIQTGLRAVEVLTAKIPDRGVRVTGLAVSSGDERFEIPADTVIDATGRRSPLIGWLRASGAPIFEEAAPTQIIYYTRFYRLHPGCEEPEGNEYPRIGDLGYLKFGIFAADNRTFSLTLVIPTIETDLCVLRREDAFERVCRHLPGVARWATCERSEPISDVISMGGHRNFFRHFVHKGRPAARGFFAVGEAAMRTNPLYARGCTLSFVHAHLLADVLSTVSGPDARAVRLDGVLRAQLYPYYLEAVRRDRESLRRAQRALAGPKKPRFRERLARSLVEHGVVPAMRGDLEVRRAILHDFHMLSNPGTAMRRPSILLRIFRFWLRGPRRNAVFYPPPLGPGRAEMRTRLGLLAR